MNKKKLKGGGAGVPVIALFRPKVERWPMPNGGGQAQIRAGNGAKVERLPIIKTYDSDPRLLNIMYVTRTPVSFNINDLRA